jgi:hypothetical protein
MTHHSLRILLLCALALGVALAALGRPAAAPARQTRASVVPADYLVAKIAHFRTETWRWQGLMGKPRTHSSRHLPADREYRHWVLGLWKKRALSARRQAASPPRKAAWLCIHRHEGPWNDPHAPYYGGLQMDMAFQRAYGSDLLRAKGTAENWTPLEQMWVAERAFRSGRGFYPWPNTARFCGLL